MLNILFAPLEKDESGEILPYLAGTVFLEQCSHSTLCNDDVMFNTDNVAYMKKAYTAALKSLFPNSVHVTCMAYIINVVGGAFLRPFDQLKKVSCKCSSMLALENKDTFNSWQKKKMLSGKRATMAPNPL